MSLIVLSKTSVCCIKIICYHDSYSIYVQKKLWKIYWCICKYLKQLLLFACRSLCFSSSLHRIRARMTSWVCSCHSSRGLVTVVDTFSSWTKSNSGGASYSFTFGTVPTSVLDVLRWGPCRTTALTPTLTIMLWVHCYVNKRFIVLLSFFCSPTGYKFFGFFLKMYVIWLEDALKQKQITQWVGALKQKQIIMTAMKEKKWEKLCSSCGLCWGVAKKVCTCGFKFFGENKGSIMNIVCITYMFVSYFNNMYLNKTVCTHTVSLWYHKEALHYTHP